MKKRKLNFICCIFTPILLVAFFTLYNLGNIPDTIFIREGQSLKANGLLDFKKNYSKNNYNVTMLGVIPVRSVNVSKVPNEISLYLGGEPIGVKISTKGVLVVGLSDIDSSKGNVLSPAAEGGVQIGDSILKINNIEVKSVEDVSSLISKSDGNKVIITIERKGAILDKTCSPVKGKDNEYRIGLWIRDSTAGVGTLTFYQKDTNKFAALGHPITDMDTGTILKVEKGEILSSSIISIRKGERGNPGELKGIFLNEENPLGNINDNTNCGIFGIANNTIINNNFNEPVKVALRNEIKEGPAKIITTIDGNLPKGYDVYIEKLLQQEAPGPKSMIIKVTDKELLEKTGGIVQGMSGSPIVQNGKLIGAVTHVLINKPDTGYGIYIEWMLKDAGILK